MKCPHCQLDLLMMSRDGVEVDYCPKCRGLWLDRGELDKLIERSDRTSHGRDDDDDDDERERYRTHLPPDRYHPPRKKSFLREFFDFD